MTQYLSNRHIMVYKIIFMNDLSYVQSIKQFADDPCLWIV
jgi:hypothetical protein